jgi:hypothetical protein
VGRQRAEGAEGAGAGVALFAEGNAGVAQQVDVDARQRSARSAA